MFDDTNEVTLEEVDEVLSEIENKYSPVRNVHKNNDLEETIAVLSKEFDSIGVPTINFSQPFPSIFKELINSTRCLVQIHRRTIAQMKDTNINSQSNHTKNNYLHKALEDYQVKVNSCKDKNSMLQNRIDILENKITEMKKKETSLKTEMEKIKRYQTEQKNDFLRQIKKLSENKNLKPNSEVHTHSTDEVLLKFVAKYKRNEDIYKATISKLEENNRKLVREIVEREWRKSPRSS